VKTGDQVGRGIAVSEGLAEGDQVVLDGISLLRPGVPVVATPSRGS
jgi:multidrug efflux pump subunit AcrA (membrane-fusion protein)